VRNDKIELVCFLCEYLLDDVSEHLPANFTLAMLDQLFDDACAHLGDIQEYCDSLVVLFGEDIYNALSGKVPPEQVCTAIHLCNPSETKTDANVAAPSSQVHQ
jgi:hypothetical protein